MQLDSFTDNGGPRRRPRPVLVWGGLALLAAVALALAIVIAGLASQLGSADPAPRTSAPARIGESSGHRRPM